MTEDRPLHHFDAARAARYQPRHSHEKTAVLVELSDPQAQTVIVTSFGQQSLAGAFYAIAEGDASYGAARHEFEATHTSLGSNRWVKNASVLAYQADVSCVVDTVIDEQLESTVNARPGDWIIRQQTGEVMVLGDEEFAERYVADGCATDGVR